MIIVQLKGGLGNQLFQYAAGLSLAFFHHVPLKVDIEELSHPDKEIGTFRNFQLQYLQEPPLIAENSEIIKLSDQGFFKKLYQKFHPSYKRTIYNERQFSFDANFFRAGPNLYLKGYRQSEKYFIKYQDIIKTLFQPKLSVTERVEKYVNRLKECNSVAIHIRRGDYSKASVQSFHGIIPALYYQQAIDKLSSGITNPSFFIFSDDINWVKENIHFNQSPEFISGNISIDHYEDFYLMSRCKHNIIANSSFSWWAAWLNPNPNKIIIAPKKWFNNAPYNTKDLIPDTWLQL